MGKALASRTFISRSGASAFHEVVEEEEGQGMVSAVRTLTPDDVLSAMELSIATNWNQTVEDWQRVIRLSSDGCRCIDSNGRIAATATRLNYGEKLAWIGMVLTRPEDRRRGYARCLMEDVIASAENQGIRTLKLDAT